MNVKKILVPAFIATTIMANAEDLKLSSLLTSTTISGDARVNYCVTDNSYANTENSDLRTRFRLNLSTKVNDFATINARVRLTNDYELGTANASASTASSVLFTDIFYFDYKKGTNEVLAGRFSPFYKINDFFITDGESEGLGYVTKIGNTDLRVGYLLGSNEADTKIIDKKSFAYGQAVYNLKSDKSLLKFEATGIALTQSEISTSDNVNGILLGVDYTQNLNSAVEFIQVRGQYIKTDETGENTGNSVGVVIGTKNIDKFGDWKAEIEYKSAGKNNSLAKSTNQNQKNVKVWAQTYVSPKMNFELEYNKRDTLKGTKTVDYSTLSASLNHTF